MASDVGPGWQADSRAISLICHDPGTPVDTSRWPATVPAVEQLLCEGLELPPGLTVLVGENGSGKIAPSSESAAATAMAALNPLSRTGRFLPRRPAGGISVRHPERTGLPSPRTLSTLAEERRHETGRGVPA